MWNYSSSLHNIKKYWKRTKSQGLRHRLRKTLLHAGEVAATKSVKTSSGPKESGDRNEGISALVRTHNESWIEPSLKSIDNYVDEIVIVDSSTDNTTNKINSIKNSLTSDIIHVEEELDLHKASNLAIELSNREWLLKWDGDFIARSDEDISIIFDEIRDCDKYLVISFPLLSFVGDLNHVQGDRIFHIEPWLFRHSNAVSYNKSSLFGMEFLSYPVSKYVKTYIDEAQGIHLHSVKPPKHYMMMRYQARWQFLSNEEKQRYDSMHDYLSEVVIEEVDSIETEADIRKRGEELIRNQIENAYPFNKGEYFELPQELVEYIDEKEDLEYLLTGT